MIDRPTPETDAAIYPMEQVDVVWPDFARKLERERDEARIDTQKAKAYKRVLKVTNAQLKRERDEAREQAQQMSESNQVLMADVRFYRNAWEQLKGATK